ncbi:MAG: carbohydrate binding family 9 domain-containing protein [Bacteroidetes bacterium]|nr:carbohydrate binding family 9 domain-containing protein [Bacteroidota bacterium]
MRKIALPVLFLCFLPVVFLAQPPEDPMKRQTSAKRIDEKIKIDGSLDEAIWYEGTLATDFKQYRPLPGEAASQQTEVRVLYDNDALYVGAILHDTAPDSILMEMSERDDMGNTDYFGIIVDSYRDGLNGLGFVVTPAGIQFDTKFSALDGGGGEAGSVFSGDTNWDAVWDSEVTLTETGWVVEMRIPYSALRFPEMEEQLWNINYVRRIRRNRETAYWHTVDPNGPNMISQTGQIDGIENITAPIRLSATPFITTYATHYKHLAEGEQGAWGSSFGGGMDIKYGINDAFTLDMTVIPDFGEAISDNRVLNLSPFEVRFDENRQFFTEGVELFNKGGFFYSRRVGGTPLGYYEVEAQLEEGESVIANPNKTSLINATKVSGRTTGGLGVGVFNAISAATYATVENTEKETTRQIETNPLTNYNVTVFDQNLPNNSFVSLINTNVWRSGDTYDANLTGTVFDIRNKANSYSVNGNAAVSQKYYTDDTDLGFVYNLGFEKTSGEWQYGLYYGVESDTYDPNDLGFLYNNNERFAGAELTYNRFKPFGNFNSANAGLFVGYSRLYNPNVFTRMTVDTWWRLTTKKFFTFGGSTYHEPFSFYDYFEPRVQGRYYKVPVNNDVGLWISTDYRKQFAIDVFTNYRVFNEPGRNRFNLEISPRLRVNDRLSFRLSVGSYNSWNDVGWVETQKAADGEVEAIYFGRRDVLTVESGLTANYNFTNRMNLNVRVRHYWSAAQYDRFNELAEDGTLLPTDYDSFNDRNFTAFNVDAVYRWRFAPGSDLFFIYKNAILDFIDKDPFASYRFFDSLGSMVQFETTNTFNLKLIYYLDYQQITSGE